MRSFEARERVEQARARQARDGRRQGKMDSSQVTTLRVSTYGQAVLPMISNLIQSR
jgi:hypothetical protein